MRHVSQIAAFAAALSFGAVTANAAPITVDFDTMNGGVPTVAGNINGNEFTDFGLTIGVTPSNASSTLALFNSNCGPDFPGAPCSGNDSDLASGPSFGTAPQGRVLIINGGTSSNPNDDPAGGVFNFSFATPVTFLSAEILDLDEGVISTLATFTFTFSNAPSATIAASSIDLLGTSANDNSLRSFNFSGVDDVVAVDLELNGISGAVASLTVEPIPVPAAAPLLASVIGAAALYQRMRSRRQS